MAMGGQGWPWQGHPELPLAAVPPEQRPPEGSSAAASTSAQPWQGEGCWPSAGWGHPRPPRGGCRGVPVPGEGGRARESTGDGQPGQVSLFQKKHLGERLVTGESHRPAEPRHWLAREHGSPSQPTGSTGSALARAGLPPAMPRRAGITPKAHPGDTPRRCIRRHPVAGWGHASAGAAGCSQAVKHRGWHRGAEDLPPAAPAAPLVQGTGVAGPHGVLGVGMAGPCGVLRAGGGGGGRVRPPLASPSQEALLCAGTGEASPKSKR